MSSFLSSTETPEVYSAGVVANLEGMKGIPLPPPSQCQATLAQLDRRVRALEEIMNITTPPPVSDRNWEAFVWRLCRVRRRNLVPMGPRTSNFHDVFTSMMPSASEVSVQALWDIVADIPGDHPISKAPWAEAKVADEDEATSLLLQQICHIWGQRQSLVEIQAGKSHLYAAAISLYLEVEFLKTPPRLGRPGMVPPPPGYRAGSCSCNCHGLSGPRRPGQPVVMSGDCSGPIGSRMNRSCGIAGCTCDCHRTTGKAMMTFLSSDSKKSKKSSLGKKIRRWSWFRKLFCLGRGRSSKWSDSSSSSTTLDD